MPNGTARLVACGLLAATALLPASSATAVKLPPPDMATKVILWYNDTGDAVVSAMTKAESAKGSQAASCSTMESVATKAMTGPFPPDPPIAYHWGLALGFYAAGGAECALAAQKNSETFYKPGAVYVDEGGSQLEIVIGDVKALIA